MLVFVRHTCSAMRRRANRRHLCCRPSSRALRLTVLHYAGIAPASLGQMHGAREGGDGGEGGRSTVGDRFRVLIIVRWVLPAPQPDLRLQ
jgi:hypothetical protein